MNGLLSYRAAGLALLLPILFGCCSCVEAKGWQPPEELVSSWFAHAQVFALDMKGEYPSLNPGNWIPISLTMQADGLVDGKLRGRITVLRSWQPPLPMFPGFALEKGTSDQPDHPALDSLVEAERAFAQTCQEKGIRESFLAFLADEAMVFRPHAVSGRKWYQERPASSGVLSWEPSFADVAASGDFGYTTGPWEYKQARTDSQSVAFGHFVSVWKKQANGEWRVVIDEGIDHPQAAARPTKVETSSKPSAAKVVDGRIEDVAAERQKLLKTDQQFSDRSAANGTVTAFGFYVASDVRLCRHGSLPFVEKEAAQAILSEKPCRLAWQPIAGDLSASGDLGYTYGKNLAV